MRKLCQRLVLLIVLVILITFSTKSSAQLGPSLPVILCNSDASVCVTSPFSVTSTNATLTLITTGQQAVTASAVALPTNTAKEVCISVLVSGTQIVYFGITGVTTSTGQEIIQGGKECRPAANSNTFFVVAGATGSTVAFEVWN